MPAVSLDQHPSVQIDFSRLVRTDVVLRWSAISFAPGSRPNSSVVALIGVRSRATRSFTDNECRGSFTALVRERRAEPQQRATPRTRIVVWVPRHQPHELTISIAEHLHLDILGVPGPIPWRVRARRTEATSRGAIGRASFQPPIWHGSKLPHLNAQWRPARRQRGAARGERPIPTLITWTAATVYRWRSHRGNGARVVVLAR